MPEWIHAILVGGGIGLFFAARELEKWAEKSKKQDGEARLKEFEKYAAHFSQQARHRTVVSAPIAFTEAPIKTRLANDVDAFRERYRHNLVGAWSTTEIIPMGCSYEFREDGTGLLIEYRGFGGWEIPFQWHSVGDWSIEIKFDYPAGYWAQYAEVGSEDEEGIGEDWERVNYDFILPEKGYCANRIVLCSAHDAQRFKESPAVIKDAWFGLRDCDGPLVLC